MTNEDRQAYISALLRERRGYEVAGDAAGVSQVDAELRRVGHEAEKPSARAEKRPADRSKVSRR